MSSGFLALMAFAPILLAGILLIGLRWPARRQRARTLCGAAGAARRGWAARRLSPHRHRSRPRCHELVVS